MSTTFPSNHHLLVRHAAIEITPPPAVATVSHPQHQLNSGNSFELNGGVTTSSLSEDSGLPLTTNSSISSGDSTRMGMCKFEFEVCISVSFSRWIGVQWICRNCFGFFDTIYFQLAAESDAEVSQFDSLENCSDGGMSAENFNTLKKVVPLAPIDPPPEFQVSAAKCSHRKNSFPTTNHWFERSFSMYRFFSGFTANNAATLDNSTTKFFNEFGQKYCFDCNHFWE